MQRSQLPKSRHAATFAIPRWKLAYVSTPKAACTTIKWMLADLLGIDAQVFTSSLSSETSRSTTIHQRRVLWGPQAPRFIDLSDKQLAEISPENGWFFFSMTRHPTARFWSAWQSKLLLHEPRFHAQFKGEPWLPRIPQSTEDVVEDWFRFVEAVDANPELEIMDDIHFRPQHRLLNLGQLPYDRLYDTSEFKQMLADLQGHLSGLGWTGTLRPMKSNESPLPPLRRAFPSTVLDVVRRTYAADFEQLGYDDPMPPKVLDEDYSADLVAATGIIAERGERIGDLSWRARKLSKQLDEALGRAHAPVSDRSEDDSEGMLPVSIARRVRRRVRRALG
jgi:hypothetical protein